jgi:hypothetical protein
MKSLKIKKSRIPAKALKAGAETTPVFTRAL